VELLANMSLLLALLLIQSVNSSAQSNMAAALHRSQASDEDVRGGSPKPAACRDTTPHTRTMVTVEKGVHLEVLDWGGADKSGTMVLLTGLGDSAHVYDQFAFQFTDYFHVIGITRRGFLPSSQPQEGYDVATRARDDIEVLRALGIRKAVFVGHSVAGSELSSIALTYKSYVEKLVYLDSFDLSDRFQLPEIPPVPYVAGSDDRSLQVFQAAQARLENTLTPAPAICIAEHFDASGAITDSTTPGFVSQKILSGVKGPTNPPTDWALIEAPRLGIFDLPSVKGKLPYYSYLSSTDQEVFNANWPGIVEWYAITTRKFAMPIAGNPTAMVYLLSDAPHYFYLSNPTFVVRVMREFLLGHVGN
jgi:pimeloyl-ACP methyl ester carboxylesterase